MHLSPFIMKKLLLYLFVFISFNLFGQAAVTKAITKLVSDTDLANAGISVCVLDVQTGVVIASHAPDRTLIPASSMKVITSGAALGILSPDYVFKTELQYDGAFNLQSGVLDGNLYIKGYGDPTLGSPEMSGVADFNTIMNQFAEAVDKAGICKVSGRVIGDGTFFQGIDGIGMNWQWDDIGNYYGAGAYGLNVNENYFTLNLQQVSLLGSTPQILGTTPYVPEITFNNYLKSAASGTGDNSLIFTAPYNDESIVRGTIPVGSGTYKVKGSMPDPVLTAAYTLQQKLKTDYKATFRKSAVNFEELKNAFSTRKTIYTQYSPKLSAIVERTNLESVNLYAETMLRTIGQVQSSSGTPSAGIDAVKNFWTAKGVNLTGFFMEDGSGLSSRSAVSSKQLASVLRAAANDNAIFPSFYNSLPKAGETGTIKNMFKGTKAIGKLRAKSGSMTRVRSYSGYVTRANGKQWSFSVIVNNYNCSGSEIRSKLQEFMVSMCE
jgi:serine-type D-Ala-D-Ala carboxypeptidase/endopeptidase (penicillin-binding protein 4)